jgi:hypothetical protein
MGCANSNPTKDLNISPGKNNKVNQILSKAVNGNEKLQNSINDTLNDVNNLEFKKAQEDLQKVSFRIACIVNIFDSHDRGFRFSKHDKEPNVKIDICKCKPDKYS